MLTPAIGKQAHAAKDNEKTDAANSTETVKAAPAPTQASSEPSVTTHANNAPKNKRIDEANIAKLVAEENETRSKFPRYPGLERWKLLEKMGDGAFSNVYRALDTQGEHGEAAIKVVRKFEMNSMQVSSRKPGTQPILLPHGVSHRSHFPRLNFRLHNARVFSP